MTGLEEALQMFAGGPPANTTDIMFGGTGMAFFAAMHYWLPKIYGRMYDKTVATVGQG